MFLALLIVDIYVFFRKIFVYQNPAYNCKILEKSATKYKDDSIVKRETQSGTQINKCSRENGVSKEAADEDNVAVLAFQVGTKRP